MYNSAVPVRQILRCNYRRESCARGAAPTELLCVIKPELDQKQAGGINLFVLRASSPPRSATPRCSVRNELCPPFCGCFLPPSFFFLGEVLWVWVGSSKARVVFHLVVASSRFSGDARARGLCSPLAGSSPAWMPGKHIKTGIFGGFFSSFPLSLEDTHLLTQTSEFK